MQNNPPVNTHKKRAFQLIILFGFVSLFGDIIYEGARSVNGPYLKTLGANAAVVGLIAGAGEFLGYALRLLSGYISDKTKGYWFLTFLGYAVLVSVPLLSLAGIWQVAALFIIAERIGKAIRSPARDTLLSQATKQVGTGFGFGLNEAMDQIGAIAGPLIFMILFMLSGPGQKSVSDYQRGYGLCWVPFILLMLCIVFAFLKEPNPEQLETAAVKKPEPDKLSKVFWLYTVFSFITTLGFVNFVLMGYHFKAKGILSDAQIPLFYAVAMAIDGVVALLIGKAYDVCKARANNEKAGLLTLIAIPAFSLFIPLLAFSNNYVMAIASVLLWGVVMGGHETIMKSAIADLTPLKRRGMGYGIFNTGYGLAMFIGSALMGLLYERSIPVLITAAMILEALSIPAFLLMRKEALRGAPEIS